jgi:hypothetical protein
MNILRRGVPVEVTRKDEKRMEEITHGRIEVTVEREWVSMLVRGHPKEGTAEPASGDSGPESEPLKLSASSLSAQDKRRR